MVWARNSFALLLALQTGCCMTMWGIAPSMDTEGANFTKQSAHDDEVMQAYECCVACAGIEEGYVTLTYTIAVYSTIGVLVLVFGFLQKDRYVMYIYGILCLAGTTNAFMLFIRAVNSLITGDSVSGFLLLLLARWFSTRLSVRTRPAFQLD